jgi:hypothetical protein
MHGTEGKQEITSVLGLKGDMQRFLAIFGEQPMQPQSRIRRFEAKDVASITPHPLLDIAKKYCKPP